MRHRVTIHLLLLITASICEASCSRVPPMLSSFASTSEEACVAPANRLITVSAPRLSGGRALVASVRGCQVELLTGCKVGLEYTAQADPDDIQPFVVRAKSIVEKVLPTDKSLLLPILQENGQFIVSVTVGRESRAVQPLYRSSLLGLRDCSRATHYARGMSFGKVELQQVTDASRIPLGNAGEPTGDDLVAFSLAPIEAGPAVAALPTTVTACPEGQTVDGNVCRPSSVNSSCLPGSQISGGSSCTAAPIHLADNLVDGRSRAETLIKALGGALTPEQSVATLLELAQLVGDTTKPAIYWRAANDPEIERACATEQQPVWCNDEAALLAAYSSFLKRADQQAAAADLDVRLVRVYSKSASTASAFRDAADKLCRENQPDAAERLYSYVRKTFPKTVVAQAIGSQACLAGIAKVNLSLTPTGGQHEGRALYGVRVWVEMSKDRLSEFRAAEYFFDHSSFNPRLQVSYDARSGFEYRYALGYGCVPTRATLIGAGGQRNELPFDMCTLWVDELKRLGIR